MLDFNPYTILFTLINLIVLWLFLRHFLFDKITAILDNRTKAVQDELTQAAQEKTEAEKCRQEYEQQLDRSREEIAELLAQSKAQAQQEYDAVLASAQKDAQHLMETTRKQLAAEREAMLRGARREVAQLALLAAARVTQKKMGNQDDMAMVDAFISEVGEQR